MPDTPKYNKEWLASFIDERILNFFSHQPKQETMEQFELPSIVSTGKKRIYIAITTYDREKHFLRLMESIKTEMGDGYDYSIHVYDDASPGDYVSKYNELPVRKFKFKVNNGKKGYWRVMDRVFQDASEEDFDYFFLLQDDNTLVSGFFSRAVSEYEAITDQRKGTYCTFTPTNVYNRIMWGGAKARDVAMGKRMYILGGYVDCIFMAPRSILASLEFCVEPVSDKTWSLNPNHSSGVGQQLTMRLKKMGKSLYTAWSSLVVCDEQESKMNPGERAKTPLRSLHREKEMTRKMITTASSERKICGIASIPSREEILKKVLISLVPQMDEIHVVLNGYSRPPAYVNDAEFSGKVTFHSDEGKAGDANKFRFVENANGYYFSCDDDIIYPANYAERMIEKLNEYDRKVLVTCHGRVVPRKTIARFYKETRQYHFMFNQKEDLPVHVPGTGVSAFHTDVLKLKFEDFKVPNMADIWVGIAARAQKVTCMCISRPQRWLHAVKTPETIFEENKFRDDMQVEIINSVNWYA